MADAVVSLDEVTRSLKAIAELDELKTATNITLEIKESVKALMALDNGKKLHLQKLITRLKHSFCEMFASVERFRLLSVKKDKLYCMFHKFTIEEGFEICSACDKTLELNAPQILWQLLMEKEFIRQFSIQLQNNSQVSPSSPSTPRILSNIEENAVRYTAGYVIRKLEQMYSKRNSKEAIECTAALKEMAGKLTMQEPEQNEHPSSEWTKIIDRGGLYHVEDVVYDLFVAIEYLVDEKLSEIFTQSGKDICQVKKENLSWLCDNEDIQFLWCLISPCTIEEESVRQCLLQEIAHLWITTRGHSKTHKIKEEYKMMQKKAVKGKRSLRKELAS